MDPAAKNIAVIDGKLTSVCLATATPPRKAELPQLTLSFPHLLAVDNQLNKRNTISIVIYGLSSARKNRPEGSGNCVTEWKELIKESLSPLPPINALTRRIHLAQASRSSVAR
jgi:hypothetical protein